MIDAPATVVSCKDPRFVSSFQPPYTLTLRQQQLADFLDKSAKKDKSSTKDALLVELFEMRRDLTSRISEDALKDKRQLDLDFGCVYRDSGCT